MMPCGVNVVNRWAPDGFDDEYQPLWCEAGLDA